MNKQFRLEEILTVVMLLFLNLLIIIFSDIAKAQTIFILNAGIIVIIGAVAYLNRFYFSGKFTAVRDWYAILLMLMIYLEHQHLIPLINPHDIDEALIKIDRFIFFGNNPTVLLEKFLIPAVTEILQIVYASFYFLPFVLCVLLYKKNKPDFHIAASVIMLGFYVSFAGYYITPAIGPRFTLEHVQTLPLEGILTLDFLRHTLGSIEGITRDCCPSGHTLVSLLTLLLARRFYRPYIPAALIWSILQIISTVYLRYHYVTDLIVSAIILFPVYATGLKLAGYYYGSLKKQEPRKTANL
jgi:membrane-associated phospholipid phosphatase